MDYIATLESYIVEDSVFEGIGDALGKESDEKWLAFFKRKIIELFRWLREKWQRFVERIKRFFNKNKAAEDKEETEDLKKQLNEKDTKIRELESKMRDLKADIAKNHEKSDAQDKQLQNLSAMLDKVEEDRKKIEAELQSSRQVAAELKEAYKIGNQLGNVLMRMFMARGYTVESQIDRALDCAKKVAAAISSNTPTTLEDRMFADPHRRFKAGDEDTDGEKYINAAKEDMLNLLKKYSKEDSTKRYKIIQRFREGFAVDGISASNTIAKAGKRRDELEKVLKILQNLKPTSAADIGATRIALNSASAACADWDRCNRIYMNAIAFVEGLNYDRVDGLQSEL